MRIWCLLSESSTVLSALEPLVKGTEELPPLAIEQHTVARAEELLMLGPAHFPALIVMQQTRSKNRPGQRNEVASFVARLRQKYPIAEVPIMVLTETEEGGLADELRPFNVIGIIGQTEWQDQRQMYELAETLILQHFDPIKANPYSLELLATLWVKQLSGELLLADGRIVELRAGGITKVNQLSLLQSMLYSLPPDYYPSGSGDFGLGDQISVGNLIWKEVMNRCEPGYLRSRRGQCFVPSSLQDRLADRLLDLEIPLQMRRLWLKMRTARPTPLTQLLQQNTIKMMQVESSLEVLSKLGFVQQIEQPKAEIQVPNSPDSQTGSLFKISSAERDRLIEQNVSLMLSQLASSNPWVALGLSPTDDLENGVQQINQQLQSLLGQLSSPSVTLAKDIARLKLRLGNQHSIAELLLHYYHHYGTPAEPFSESESRFCLAQEFIRNHQWRRAAALLSELDHSNPRYSAHWGWSAISAHFFDEGSSPQALEDESSAIWSALESLYFAATTQNSSPIIRCFCATAEAMVGRWESAEHALSLMLRKRNTVQIRSLMNATQGRQINRDLWIFNL